VPFKLTDQLMIRSYAFFKYWRKNWSTGTVHQLFIDFKKAYHSVRKKVVYNSLIKFGIPMKRDFTNYSVFKWNLPDNFLFRMVWTIVATAFQLCFRICYQEGPRKPGRNETGWETASGLLGDNINTIKKNTEALIEASKEVGLEVNTGESKYMLISHHQNAGQNHTIW
jgi:hypothetical protein